MKFISLKPALLSGALVAAITLAGCTGMQHRGPHGGMMGQGGTTGQGGQMGQGGMMGQGGQMGQGGMMGQGGQMGQGGMMMGQGGQMDMKSMCAMHERMKSARTPQERSAMMDQYMTNMTPEMRQRHMEMLERQCR